jgi:hypothetical protein
LVITVWRGDAHTRAATIRDAECEARRRVEASVWGGTFDRSKPNPNQAAVSLGDHNLTQRHADSCNNPL